jgi:hypothetical protein
MYAAFACRPHVRGIYGAMDATFIHAAVIQNAFATVSI